MLLDDAIVSLRHMNRAGLLSNSEDKVAGVIDGLGLCEPFVLSPLVMQTCEDLINPEAVQRSRPHLFTPSDLTWLDCSAQQPSWVVEAPAYRRAGLALFGGRVEKGDTPSLTWGFVVMVMETYAGIIPASSSYDLRGQRPIIVPTSNHVLPTGVFVDYDRMGEFIAVALALINTPRLADIRSANLSKLNKARLKRKAPPLLQYKTVHIKVDQGKPGEGFQRHETKQKALHHVRAFLRLARGRVQIVRPHWRGNAKFGIVKHRYVVLRAEDEAGAWTGGPLPPPQLIGKFERDE